MKKKLKERTVGNTHYITFEKTCKHKDTETFGKEVWCLDCDKRLK